MPKPVFTSVAPGAALYAMRRDPLAFFTKLAQEQGDIACFRLGDHEHDLYLLNHPDYIREVVVAQDRNFTKWFAVDRIKEVLGQGLFVSEGDFHLTQRRLSQPAFRHEQIASYAEQMTSLALRLGERWRPNTVVDICREMNWLAMMIVAGTLFGADVESDAEEIRAALSEILEQFERSILPPADRKDFENALGRLDSVVYRMIKERRATGIDSRDLLSVFLLAEDSEKGGRRMSDQQVRDEVMTIFLAGHETSANALAWSWYLLSQHPEVEAEFHEEVDRVLNRRIPRFDQVPKLGLTARIFAEALRLYPPAWAIGRSAIRECRIGDVTIAPGSVVILSQYVTHRDPRWFPNPEAFDPNRWTTEARSARPRFCYFPFSGGSRSCLGEGFAGMEGALCLATLAQKWRLKLVPGHPIALQPQLTLRARHGIKMRIEPRV
ncbi:MAG TPA: cytochrome P450 [Chthoniobacterales bacterium]|jgi:cytochrome P450|nr:cytochrome P450 [Chthoniobacterales bacterium]